MTGPEALERGEVLRARLEQVHERIDAACRAVGRPREDVHLIVVTKYFPAQDVVHLHGLGIRAIGENRDQEASEKVQELPPSVREDLTVHFIGQLQSNKARHVARYADVVQSVDRAKVARALAKGAQAADRTLEVLVQVDLAQDDPGRGGAAPDQVAQLAEQVAQSPGLALRGVMAVAPLGVDPRAAFARLAQVADRVRSDHPEATWISAGMSGDLEDAVACGATHLRVGSAILGSRPVQR